MSALTFYFKVLQALEEIKAPYMIVGAFAGLAYGYYYRQAPRLG